MGVLFGALRDGLGQRCAGGCQLGFDDGDLLRTRPSFCQIELRLSAEGGRPARQIDVAELQRRLKAVGAYLPNG